MKIRAVPLLLILFVVILFVLAMLISLLVTPREAHAEWHRMGSYGGRITDTHYGTFRWADQPLAPAYWTSDWFVQGSELRYITVGKKNTEPVVDNQGVNYILASALPSTVLFQIGDMARYNLSSDTAILIAGVAFDTVRTTQGDSVVYRTDSSTSQWLKLTLADMNSLTISGKSYPLIGFYDDTTAWFADTMLTTDTLVPNAQTVNLQTASGIPSAVRTPDTTWIVDGNKLFIYQSDFAGNLTYPAVSEFVVLDSAARRGDSLLLYGNFSSTYGSSYWCLWSDTLGNRGIPGQCIQLLNDGTAFERMWVSMDSARYAAYSDGVGFAKSAHALIVAETQKIYERTISGKLDYLGKYGPTTCYLYAMNDTSWIASLRDWDCAAYRLKLPGNQYYYGKIIRRPSSDSLNLFLWRYEPGSPTYGGSGLYNVGIEIYNSKRLAMVGSSAVANEYTDITLADGRAWFAGSKANPTKYTFSYPYDYDSVNTGGIFGVSGNDPTLKVSPFPSIVIAAYGRHHIENLTGDITVTSSLRQEMTAQVGTFSAHCVAHDPKRDVDVFCNENGIYTYDGGSAHHLATGFDDYFRDSVSPYTEASYSGAVWGDKYWFVHDVGPASIAAQFVARRMIYVDLNTGAVGTISGFNPQFVFTYRDPYSKERLFVGDADSTVIWEIGAEDELYRKAVWQSGWDDFGDHNAWKQINQMQLSAYAGSLTGTDSLIVEFLGRSSTNLIPGTTLWADTLLPTGALESGVRLYEAPVGRAVQGGEFGIRLSSPDSSVIPMDLQVDVVPMGTVRPQQ